MSQLIFWYGRPPLKWPYVNQIVVKVKSNFVPRNMTEGLFSAEKPHKAKIEEYGVRALANGHFVYF